ERAVLLRCLQKDPAARYQSVHDLIAAFGAPSSVGAAAWTDVRAGAGASSPTTGAPAVPPPLPSPPPPPEDPYAGFGRASREAARHAAKIARRAMIQARQVAQRAAKSANEVMRETMANSRGRHFRRWRAWQRLRKQRHTWKEQREAMRAAAAAVGRPQRRHRGGWVALAVFAALVFVPMVLMTMGTPSHYTDSMTPATVSDGRAAIVSTPRQTLRVFRVPPQYEGLVSRSEPQWVLLAQQDREQAHDLLVQSIEQLRREAPLSPELRATPLDLPSFEVITLDGRAAQKVHTQLDEFLRARSYDRGIAEKLAKQAPASLVLAAGRLGDIRWADAADRKRAQRLQQFLEQTTGCRNLSLIDDDTPEAQVANKNLGALWMWFVNEFGNTPRTWETYRSLLKLK
ncbi:MAG TPA: hypothetical protein VFD82_06570, partial [Planctomycetota bacterium]|nr:hypothetical protein [Planctomycetota bacterium]